jgi:hypothetical protein
MPYLHLYWKTQEEEMAVDQHASRPKSSEVLSAQHLVLQDGLLNTLCRASDLIRKRRAELREAPLPTSLPGFDRLLGGGLPRGEIVELVGRGSCGRFATLLATLRAVTGAGETAALVDQGSQLDPQAATELGVDLERLLWLRPQNLCDSLAAAELLIHTGFPLVVLDLGLSPVRGRAPLAAWLRLARAAATHQAIVLVGSPYRLSGCAAGAVVTAGRGRGNWSRSGASRLLRGLRARLHLSKRIGRPNCDQTMNILTVPDAAFAEEQISDLPSTQPGDSKRTQAEEKRRKSNVAAL